MRVPMSLLVVVTTFALVTSAVAGSAGRCGGDGGNHTTTLTCPEGQYVAAIGARAGAFIDDFSIACREIPVSGNPGPLGNYMSGGPGGGTRSRSGQCGGGGAVWEIWVNSGGYVDKIKTAGCATRGAITGAMPGVISIWTLEGEVGFFARSSARKARCCIK